MDIFANLKNPEKFFKDYQDFMIKWNLPYTFFPYYIYFNKILPKELGKPNPRFLFNLKNNEKLHVVIQPAYGFLMLDIKKLKFINFNFNVEYSEIYYLQDMIEQCFKKNLWISNCYFIDRFESWKDLKKITTNGILINMKKYNEEKIKYNKLNIQYMQPQIFIEKFKGKYNL